jgi:hypothetical protein
MAYCSLAAAGWFVSFVLEPVVSEVLLVSFSFPPR